MINDVYKNRSCLGCFSSSLSIYSTNFKKIFRGTWAWTLALSVVIGLMTFVSNTLAQQSYSNLQIICSLGICCALAVFGLFLDAIVKTNVITMLNDDKLNVVFKKMLLIDALVIVWTVLGTIIFVASTYLLISIDWIKSLPASTFGVLLVAIYMCMFLLMSIIISPYIYSVSKFAINNNSKFKNVIGSDYAIGYKKLGYLFSIFLLLILVGAIVCSFLCIPGIVTNIATNINNFGVMQGDESGIPNHFQWLNFLATVISTFIIQYVFLWVMFVFLYAFGNVEVCVNNNLLSEETKLA